MSFDGKKGMFHDPAIASALIELAQQVTGFGSLIVAVGPSLFREVFSLHHFKST